MFPASHIVIQLLDRGKFNMAISTFAIKFVTQDSILVLGLCFYPTYQNSHVSSLSRGFGTQSQVFLGYGTVSHQAHCMTMWKLALINPCGLIWSLGYWK